MAEKHYQQGTFSLEKTMQATKNKKYVGPDPDLMKKLANSPELVQNYRRNLFDEVPEARMAACRPESEVESNPADKKAAKASPENKDDDSETRYLRDFPLAAVEYARQKFPAARSMSDAVTAYVYVESGRNFDVPERIKKLAKTWTGDKSFESMNDQLCKLEQTTKELLKLVEELSLVNHYILFDRLGFRRIQPATPDKIDLMEPGMDAFIESAKRQAAQLRKKRILKEGRPQKQRGEHDE